MKRHGIPLLATTLSLPSIAFAQTLPGATIHFSGYLTDLGGAPINGLVDVEVRILDQPIGGNELFYEQQRGIVVEEGSFELDIGSVEPMTAAVFEVADGQLTGGGRYVGLRLDGDPSELSPRFPITIVPFAMRSLLGDGTPGPQGAPGPAGPIGATGPAGPEGPAGPAGTTGPAGPQGAPGSAGPTGSQGPQGAPGVDGASVDVRALDIGHQDCAYGGIAVTSTSGTAMVCHGSPGLDGIQGPAGPQGPEGPAGADGADGAQGPQGLTGPAGADGAQGPQGLTGPAGADGTDGTSVSSATLSAGHGVCAYGGTSFTSASGTTYACNGTPGDPATSAPRLLDSNDATIGRVISAGGHGVTVLTSSGHVLSLEWDGTMSPAQIYYTGGGCTGTAYLNSGWSEAGPYWAKQVVFSGSFGSLMMPTGANPNNLTPNTAFTAAAIDNPTCGLASGTRHGYLLATTTATVVGLPSYPLTAPLRVE